MKKSYILDTSVIVDDPLNLLQISDSGENDIYITDIVLSELNNKKEDGESEAGFGAREFFRNIDKSKSFKVKLESNFENDMFYQLALNFDGKSINLYVIFRQNYRVSRTYTEAYGLNDAKIAEIAKDYNLILVTSDKSFEIASNVQGIQTESLNYQSVDSPEKIEFSHQFEFQKGESPKVSEELSSFEQISFKEIDTQFEVDKFSTGCELHALLIDNHLEFFDPDEVAGDSVVKPINLEQKFYYKILTHPKNRVTVVSGSTGSGKTLIGLQAAMKLYEDGVVDGIMYSRNTVTATDKFSELGFRKGDEEQKLSYFMYPLYSSINFIIDKLKKSSIQNRVNYAGKTNSIKKESATAQFMKKYGIEVVDIAHLRGTTISKKVLIIDEVQNMSNKMLKLIGTRIGEDTILILMGDIKQIDHPYLTKNRNALATMLKRAKEDNSISAIQLRKTVRSEISAWFDKNL